MLYTVLFIRRDLKSVELDVLISIKIITTYEKDCEKKVTRIINIKVKFCASFLRAKKITITFYHDFTIRTFFKASK
jgi:hypothetical protein